MSHVFKSHKFIALLVLASLYGVWIIFVSPLHEFPLSDDWAYAQSVRHFLNTGEVRLSEWASTTLVFQIYWGALFAKLLGGFSFSALRISTLVMSFIGCYGLYDLLCQYELAPAEALLGAIVLAVNPIYIYLSYTFLSDIFLFGLMMLSSTFYVRGLKRESNWFLLVGSVFATAAYLARQLGILLPLGLAVTLLLSVKYRKLSFLLSACLIPFAIFIIHNYWLRYLHGYPWAFTLNTINNGFTWILRWQAPFDLLLRIIFSTFYLGLLTAPLAINYFLKQNLWREKWFEGWLILGTVGVVLITFSTQRPMPYLADAINLTGLGASTLTGTKVVITPTLVFWLITGVAPVAGALYLTIGVRALQHIWHARNVILLPLVLANFLMIGLTLTTTRLWDRYLIVFLPFSLYALLSSINWTWKTRSVVIALYAGSLAYSLIELSDYLAWNEARWQAGRALMAQGVAPEKIDGGFEWAGWYTFETNLPLLLARDNPDDTLLSWINITPPDYWLSFTPLPDYALINQTTYRSWLGQGNIYSLGKTK